MTAIAVTTIAMAAIVIAAIVIAAIVMATVAVAAVAMAAIAVATIAVAAVAMAAVAVATIAVTAIVIAAIAVTTIAMAAIAVAAIAMATIAMATIAVAAIAMATIAVTTIAVAAVATAATIGAAAIGAAAIGAAAVIGTGIHPLVISVVRVHHDQGHCRFRVGDCRSTDTQAQTVGDIEKLLGGRIAVRCLGENANAIGGIEANAHRHSGELRRLGKTEGQGRDFGITRRIWRSHKSDRGLDTRAGSGQVGTLTEHLRDGGELLGLAGNRRQQACTQHQQTTDNMEGLHLTLLISTPSKLADNACQRHFVLPYGLELIQACHSRATSL
jgi:hypothetical protein